MTLEEIKRAAVFAALQRHRGHKPTAAAELGIALKTLYNMLDRYAVDDEAKRCRDIDPSCQPAGDVLNIIRDAGSDGITTSSLRSKLQEVFPGTSDRHCDKIIGTAKGMGIEVIRGRATDPQRLRLKLDDLED
jgi:hypothetical protein